MRSELLFRRLHEASKAAAILCTVFFGPLGGALAADDAGPGTGAASLWDSVLKTLNVKTTVGPTPGFVEATHPDPSGLKFIPTGTPHPKRPSPAKTADDIDAAKAALDAAHDAQLGLKPSKAKTALKSKLAKPRRAMDGT